VFWGKYTRSFTHAERWKAADAARSRGLSSCLKANQPNADDARIHSPSTSALSITFSQLILFHWSLLCWCKRGSEGMLCQERSPAPTTRQFISA